MEIWGGSEAATDAVSTPGVDFWIHSRPHEGDTAGGDIHYVSVCGQGRVIRAALADVSGHGAVVAELAQNLRGLVRRHINTPDQSRFARALNNEFSALSTRGAFATAILATYHGPSERLILCNAGHPRPLLYRSAQRRWHLLDVGELRGDRPRALRNLPLGVIGGTSYEQGVTELHQGDLVLLYTDAFIEASSPTGEMLGERGFLDIAQSIEFDSQHPDAYLERVLGRVREHQGDGSFGDDVTMVLLRQNGSKANLSVGDRVGMMAKMLGLKKV